jgi:murein DD-endopeptidase MepM/ murein hydrolase activator NlpD
MRELLSNGGRFKSPVIKKAAAIILSITLTVIGSVSVAHASDSEMIAAKPAAIMTLTPFTTNNAIDIFGLPKREAVTVPPQIEMPMLDEQLANFIRNPDFVLGEDHSHADSRIPTLSGLITSAFGYRKHPVRGKVKHHNGIDLAAKLGTPVFAPASGQVIFAGTKNGYGNVVEIDHGNGYVSLLAHHSRLLVKVGDLVTATTEIAKAGRTGIATGVHVHVEIRKDGRLLNPIAYVAK